MFVSHVQGQDCVRTLEGFLNGQLEDREGQFAKSDKMFIGLELRATPLTTVVFQLWDVCLCSFTLSLASGHLPLRKGA